MKKSLLILPILISFISCTIITHASSGDITIGNKTYTQEQAQKQIVEPLIQRIQKQKIAKIQSRIVNMSIRQYTNKQQSAQKQGKTDLANFYSGVIDVLKGKMNTIGTVSTSVYMENQGNHSQNSTTNQSSGTANRGGLGTTSEQTGLTGQAYDEAKTQGQVTEDYNIYKKMNLLRTDFLAEIASKHGGTNSYAYKYAQTLSFGNSTKQTPNINNNGGATTDQTGLTGVAAEQNRIRGNVNGEYQNIDLSVVSKAQFLQYISENYGGTNSYAYQYAKTLSFSK